MRKYVFNLTYRNKEGEYMDDENVWIPANSKEEARNRVKEEYPRASDYVLTKID